MELPRHRLVHDFAQAVERGEPRPVGERHQDDHRRPELAFPLPQFGLHRLQAVEPLGGGEQRVGIKRPGSRREGGGIGHLVHLVEHRHQGQLAHAELGQHLVHHPHLLFPAGVARVHHVQQQIRAPHLFQGGAEAGDQVVRQLADEAHGVRHPRPAPLAQVHLAGEGVESGEEPVLDEDVVLAGEHAQHARLAGVGVPHERHREQRGAVGPQHLAVLLPLLQLVPEQLDLAPDHPAVGLELGFAGAPEPDAAADTGQVGPHPRQPRQQVGQLGQLHLQLGLVGAGPGGEDVEDQLGPVHDPALELLLEVGALVGGELLVEDHEGGAGLAHQGPQFLDLPFPDQRRRVGRGHLLRQPAHHHRARGVGEPGQFIQVLGKVVGVLGALARRAHQDGALRRRLDRDQVANAVRPPATA